MQLPLAVLSEVCKRQALQLQTGRSHDVAIVLLDSEFICECGLHLVKTECPNHPERVQQVQREIILAILPLMLEDASSDVNAAAARANVAQIQGHAAASKSETGWCQILY